MSRLRESTATSPCLRSTTELGSFTETLTDEDGHFRLNLLPSGPAVFWILPKDYALSTHVLKSDKRGDLGTIKLTEGNAIQGMVVDTQGKPVAGVYARGRSRTTERVSGSGTDRHRRSHHSLGCDRSQAGSPFTPYRLAITALPSSRTDGILPR